MLGRTSSWVHALGAVFGALFAAPLVLSLMACQPERPPPTPGVRGVLHFEYPSYGPTGLHTLAADGAEATLATAPVQAGITFVSADPTIVTIEADGDLVTGEPGTVEILAMDGAEEVDRIRLTVARASRFEVTAGYSGSMAELMVPGFEQTLSVQRISADGRTLVGRGGVEIAASGALAAEADSETESRDPWRSFFRVTALEPGAGTVTLSAGDVVETSSVMVVEEADVDEVRELYRYRGYEAADDGDVTVLLGFEARIAGVSVAGAQCAWTVDGAELIEEHVDLDGYVSVTFDTVNESFTASCTIGDVTRDVAITVADLAN